ncbi:DNA-3-methyladenine glycosylase, partial [bacterium]
ALLGARLVRQLDGVEIAGIITEVEAYRGEEDLACHARAGRTPRTAVMYGPPGRAYVYFTYGMHWMLNVVCMPEGSPSAILVRAIQPVSGLETIAARRSGVAAAHWTDGPAKLCRALSIDRALNGCDLTDPAGGLWIEPGQAVTTQAIHTSPRIGINYAPEPWKSQPWRFTFSETH